MTVDATPKKESTPRKQTYINKTQAIFSLKNAKWVEENVETLIGLANHYLSTYMNPNRKPAKEGGWTDQRNKKVTKILEYLQELEKKTE